MEEEEEESIYLFVPFYDIITMIKLVIRRYQIFANFEEFRRGSGTYAIKPDRGDRRHDFSVKREV